MFSGKSDKTQQDILIQEHIDHYTLNQKEFRELTPDSEYQTFIGQEYNTFKQQDGKIRGTQAQLKQADLTAVQNLYISGHDQQKIAETVLRRSPATRKMSQGDRARYKKLLLKGMNKVEPKRQKKQEQKQTYGVKTNCKRDIDNYLKCMRAERQARAKGMIISHLNYRQFQKEKSPNFHKSYAAKIEKQIAQQEKIDRERKQKMEQQKQQQIQRQRSK